MRSSVRKVLLEIHFLNLFRNLFEKSGRLINLSLMKAEKEARTGLSYPQTPDSIGPLSKSCEGDNFVVIARKIKTMS